MATTKQRMRDFQRCLRTIQSFSDNQAEITEWDEESLDWVLVTLRPNDGYYVGGTFDFKIYFEKNYPKTAPRVDCLTSIYHPNIDSTSADYNVCLSLFDTWEPSFGLEDAIQGLLFLLYNPNVEDPLSPYFHAEMDMAEVADGIRLSLEGGEVDGAEIYDRNLCEDAVDDALLTRNIQAILERAQAVVLREDSVAADEAADAESEPAESAAAGGEATGGVVETPAPLSRQESRTDKTELISPVVTDTDLTARAAPRGRSLGNYIPQTFITTQPDFLVNVFMTCVELVNAR